jgi:hypothetical protein
MILNSNSYKLKRAYESKGKFFTVKVTRHHSGDQITRDAQDNPNQWLSRWRQILYYDVEDGIK